MKEFEVGDQVAIIGTVSSVNENNKHYKIEMIRKGSPQKDATDSFTLDGKYYIQDTEQNVFLLSELKSEYPKEMMVSNKPITEENEGNKRIVIAEYSNRYIAVSCASGYFDWLYAKDIPAEPTKEQKMDNIEKLIEQCRKEVSGMQTVIDNLNSIAKSIKSI